MPETQSSKRLLWLLYALLGWAGAIFLRLIWLQGLHHDDLLKLAQQQQQHTVEIQAQRGSILDRTGQPLAKSLPAESVCVNPQKIHDAAVAAALLAPELKLETAKLREKIDGAMRRGSGFLWIKRKVSAEEAERVRSMKLDWVEFRMETRRFYPHGQLAAHVLGSTGIVNQNDTIERGNAGIERSFDDELSGTPGQVRVFNDVKQNPYDSVVARKPEPGSDVMLTIDPNLQYEAEKELAKAAKASASKSGSIVVMNPYTGEILAMANYPTFDPNEPPASGEPKNARDNLAVTSPFEPGSVFKVITLSAALESTKLTPETMINCGNGSINVFGRVVHDHTRGVLSMADVLAKSSNVGAIQIGLRVGDRNMYKYVRQFGFGKKTGIDLPGESSGMLTRVEKWSASSIGSVAMGHEIGVTSIQMALAGAAIANGGLLVKPRIVMGEKRPGESLEKFATEKPVRIIAPETAIKMRMMMEGVVLHGTGHKYATLRGYTSGGKTGTAQIYDREAGAYTHNYNASFLGFAPVANPQVVIAVTLHGSRGGDVGFGGPVAGPVFREVAMTALRMLDVPKDLPETMLRASRDDAHVDANDLPIASLSAGLRSEEEQALPSVPFVTPPPVQAGSVAPPASESGASQDANLNRRPFFTSALVGPKVPDFRGMTLRAVLEESSAAGLSVEVLGSGLARNQAPAAGTVLPPGARVRVQFTR